MEARRWGSSVTPMEAVDGAGGGGGAGGPSRRPPRRGPPRPGPYGQTPRRWLPKLPVASRILPSLFPSSSSHEPTASENEQEDHHESVTVMPDSHSAEPTGLDAPANGGLTSANNKVNLLLDGDYRNPNDRSGLSEIEKIIKQKHFSRGETERLIELMRSRTPDLCHEDRSATRLIAKDIEVTPFSKDFGSLSTPAQQVDFQSTWKASNFAHSNVHEVGSSPIEIAKAYMEAKASVSVHDSQRRKFRALGHTVDIDNSASANFPTTATKSPVCWPGSVVQDYPNYLTPQTNRGRTVHQTFSRAPYSGSVSPRSIKRTGYRDTYNNLLSGRTQPTTPFSASSKAVAEDRITSVGGVHGAQASTSSKGTYVDDIGTSPFLPREGSAALKNLSFNFRGAHGKGAAESSLKLELASVVDDVPKCAAGSVHPKSSETAQKILQHLDRAIPSPMAKSLELRQIAAKRAASSIVSDSQDKRLNFTTNGRRLSSNDERGTVNQELSDAKKVQAPPSSSNAEEFIPRFQNSKTDSEVPPMPNSRDLCSSESASTSTSATVVSDKSTSNGFTFTFPVTTASNSLPEPPPTPTMTSPPASSLPVGGEVIPKFTFGSSNSADNLVFSFDSGSSSVGADATIPNFKFGSDEKRELSFSVVGEDAICY